MLTILKITIIALLLLINGPCIITSEGPSEAAHRMLKAAERGDTEKVVDYILNKHVILNTKNNYGVSAIIFAANNGHLDLVEALIEIGADIEDRSNNWRTPLIWSSLWGHLSVVQVLVEAGANISAFDIEGMTPILSAVRNGHMEVVEYLFDHGANITVKNFYNATALSIARTRGDTRMVNFLEPHFVDEDVNPDPYEVLVNLVVRETSVFIQVLLEETSWIYHRLGQAAHFIVNEGPQYIQPAKIRSTVNNFSERLPEYVEDAHNMVVRSQAFVQIQLIDAVDKVALQMPGLINNLSSHSQSVMKFCRGHYNTFKKSDYADRFRELGSFVLKSIGMDEKPAKSEGTCASNSCKADAREFEEL